MNITKCDICEKEIQHGESMGTRFGYEHSEFCTDCGVPVLTFLQEHKLVNKSKKEKI